jgi:hypothetical protein
MIYAGAWLEVTLGLETLSIGRKALDREGSFTLEMSGKHLCYFIKLDGTLVFLSAQLMDAGDEPELFAGQQLMDLRDGPPPRS